MPKPKRIAIVLGSLLAMSAPAWAAPTYIALGDSITFGETDLTYVQLEQSLSFILPLIYHT